MHDIGTLYVLSNRDQSLAKIGLTRDGTPDARATDYERAHGIRWHVYWSAVTCHVAEAEAAAHRELDICRFALVPGAREVFHVTPQKAQRVAARYVVPPSGAAQQPNNAHTRALPGSTTATSWPRRTSPTSSGPLTTASAAMHRRSSQGGPC